ncbi:MAG: chemotaxis protein CheW [Thermoleophilia bacterium]|jgi:purine-binding chemotaxis protein CheW|nr:chemotaxis protein CheW [Thermoleophilia bacterium]
MSTQDPAPAGEGQEGGRQVVAFTLGRDEYAVPITQVQEIIRYSAPRSMPGAPAGVEGVINLRGRIIPVMNLRASLGAAGELGDQAKIVVVKPGEETIGLVVDEVTEVRTLAADQLEAAPPGSSGMGADVVECVAKLEEGRLLVLLDLPRLLGAAAD